MIIPKKCHILPVRPYWATGKKSNQKCVIVNDGGGVLFKMASYLELNAATFDGNFNFNETQGKLFIKAKTGNIKASAAQILNGACYVVIEYADALFHYVSYYVDRVSILDAEEKDDNEALNFNSDLSGKNAVYALDLSPDYWTNGVNNPYHAPTVENGFFAAGTYESLRGVGAITPVLPDMKIQKKLFVEPFYDMSNIGTRVSPVYGNEFIIITAFTWTSARPTKYGTDFTSTLFTKYSGTAQEAVRIAEQCAGAEQIYVKAVYQNGGWTTGNETKAVKPLKTFCFPAELLPLISEKATPQEPDIRAKFSSVEEAPLFVCFDDVHQEKSFFSPVTNSVEKITKRQTFGTFSNRIEFQTPQIIDRNRVIFDTYATAAGGLLIYLRGGEKSINITDDFQIFGIYNQNTAAFLQNKQSFAIQMLSGAVALGGSLASQNAYGAVTAGLSIAQSIAQRSEQRRGIGDATGTNTGENTLAAFNGLFWEAQEAENKDDVLKSIETRGYIFETPLELTGAVNIFDRDLFYVGDQNEYVQITGADVVAGAENINDYITDVLEKGVYLKYV